MADSTVRLAPSRYWRFIIRVSGPQLAFYACAGIVGLSFSLVLRNATLAVVAITPLAMILFVAALPLLGYPFRRIRIAGEEVQYGGLLSRRHFHFEDVAAIRSVDAGVRAPDPQIVVIGRGGSTLLRVHAAFWPAALEDDLRRRLPTNQAAAPGATSRAVRAATQPVMLTWAVMLPLLAVTFLAIAASLLRSALVTLPSDYDRLAARGVAVDAQVTECSGGHNRTCELAYTYAGTTTRWAYPQNSGQFAEAGSVVTLLVDPSDPSIRYTAVDVQGRFNAGFGLAAAFGLVSAVIGLGTMAGGIAVVRALRRPC